MATRVVIVTGASSGIGAATALRLADPRTRLILHARRSKDALESVAASARAKGAEVATLLGDFSDASVPKRLVEFAEDSFGQLDGVVANAGFPIFKTFEDGTPSDLDYAFQGNVYSFFSLVKEALPYLKASASGRVVAVGSYTSHLFRTDLRLYPMSSASKGALETAVRSAAMHLAASGVTVNCVVPGIIRKDAGTREGMSDAEMRESSARIPLQRPGLPDEVAAAIEFLMSPGSSYITGQSLHVNGGLVM